MSEPEQPDVPLGDVLGDVPLFRELQRVIMSSTGPINWELARQVGITMASWGAEDPAPTDEDRRMLADTVRAAELAVADLTALPSPTDLAEVQAVRRAKWVEASIEGLRPMLEPMAQKVTAALAETRGTTLPLDVAGTPNEMLELLMDKMVPLLLGTQVGSALGALGQRVLGLYDLAVPRTGPRLLFVISNIATFEREWSLDVREFRAWVALHEVTHRFEFAQPWVHPHALQLVTDMVEHATIDLAGLQDRMEGMDLANPNALSDAFEGLGSLFGQAADDEQRLRIARVQAFLAAAESYGDHVHEALAAKMLPSSARIEEAVLRFREGRPADRALEQLLGVEMTPEQYRLGRDFCARVVALTDLATLSRMWGSADSLPSMPELDEPTLWLSRMA
jgi:putative hydrolase